MAVVGNYFRVLDGASVPTGVSTYDLDVPNDGVELFATCASL